MHYEKFSWDALEVQNEMHYDMHYEIHYYRFA